MDCQKAQWRGMRSLWRGGLAMPERRSAAHAGAQLDWVNMAHGEGVGARQGHGQPAPRGGGYLDECTPDQLWEEAKFRELAEMGLPQVWLDVARDIGYDAFMRMWRRLDAAVELRDEAESMIEVKLRRYSSFQRFQRNRFIETLVALGVSGDEIRERVTRAIGEKLSISHIRRLSKRLRHRVQK